tara:strand:+ start:247 stop:417 length:171 start_codon:yes stop_codon:yes gene_type:complete
MPFKENAKTPIYVRKAVLDYYYRQKEKDPEYATRMNARRRELYRIKHSKTTNYKDS